MKWFKGISFLLLFWLVFLCRVGDTANQEVPDVVEVQHHLKQMFDTIRPDLKGRGFELESVGGDLDDVSGGWSRIRGEFRGPVGRDGKRVYFRLVYRLLSGRPVDVKLSKGVMRDGHILAESPPILYQEFDFPHF